ncbi:MAG: preprotein translocase subunit TatA [Methylocystis sp.]|uniref:preprotein translocase subunit TatA n=1 Tax=Methylocystis sp. TaxID=1911079 RepID=UPI003DA263A2
MFDLDAGKLIVIGIVALVAIPSKDLPRVLRTVGQMTGRMRRMAADFQGQLMEALREAEVADLKKEFDETNRKIMDSVKLEGAFDPLGEARKQMTQAIEGDIPSNPLAPHEEMESNAPQDEEPPAPAPKEEGARDRI